MDVKILVNLTIIFAIIRSRRVHRIFVSMPNIPCDLGLKLYTFKYFVHSRRKESVGWQRIRKTMQCLWTILIDSFNERDLVSDVLSINVLFPPCCSHCMRNYGTATNDSRYVGWSHVVDKPSKYTVCILYSHNN